MSNVEKNLCILGHTHHNIKLLNPYWRTRYTQCHL